MGSILEEDVCVGCNKNNGVNSGIRCKYCNDAMCKNLWTIEGSGNTEFVISTHTFYKHFEDFKIDSYVLSGKRSYVYKFIFKKFEIDFEKEKIIFYVDNLPKPLIIKFNDLYTYKLQTSQLGITHSLVIILNNLCIIGIGFNAYNSKIYKIFNKMFITK
jgi:hypothetical protein